MRTIFINIASIVTLTAALTLAAVPSKRLNPPPKTNAKKATVFKNSIANKRDKAKNVAALEKERATLLNKYQQRTRRMQSLRDRNQSLVASITRLENELEITTVRQQALQA